MAMHKNITAIILAAGQGKRLLPHTADIPKCLVEVNGVPILHQHLYNVVAAEKMPPGATEIMNMPPHGFCGDNFDPQRTVILYMKENEYVHLKEKIREIENFPTPGVNFKDITPLLEDRALFHEIVEELGAHFKDKNIAKVVGVDARGFLLASAVAYVLNAGMVIVRKRGKLPYETIVREHDLEYGRGALEIHTDAVKKGERVLVIDDVLATGGTAEAAVKLVEELGGVVAGIGFLVEVPFGGRERLKAYDIASLIRY